MTPSKILQERGHGGVQATRDNLKCDETGFPLSELDVGDVATVHIESDCHIRLSPALCTPASLDALPQFHEQGMFFSGHISIVFVGWRIMCLACQTYSVYSASSIVQETHK
jgi:hypothetical protein